MEPVILPIHFGNLKGKHEISSDSLLVLIESYKEISEFFGLSVEVRISVPEDGGWKANLILMVSLLGANPFIALITGKTADEWGKEGHVHIVKAINEFLTEKADDLSEQTPRDCIKSKNKIYNQLQSDECIDSFGLGGLPPIPKDSFYLYIKELPDEEHIYLGEADITVSSPDWKGKRSWRGKIDIIEEKGSSFAFDKELTGRFWEKVKLNALSLRTEDVMKVQLVQRPTNKVKYLVIRVLSYNGEVIDSPVLEVDINKAYGAPVYQVAENPVQKDLFDE